MLLHPRNCRAIPPRLTESNSALRYRVPAPSSHKSVSLSMAQDTRLIACHQPSSSWDDRRRLSRYDLKFGSWSGSLGCATSTGGMETLVRFSGRACLSMSLGVLPHAFWAVVASSGCQAGFFSANVPPSDSSFLPGPPLPVLGEVCFVSVLGRVTDVTSGVWSSVFVESSSTSGKYSLKPVPLMLLAIADEPVRKGNACYFVRGFSRWQCKESMQSRKCSRVPIIRGQTGLRNSRCALPSAVVPSCDRVTMMGANCRS